MRSFITIVAVALLLVPACDDADPDDEDQPDQPSQPAQQAQPQQQDEDELAPVEGRIDIDRQLDDEELEAVEELVEEEFQQRFGTFSHDARTAENGPLFVELAARNDDAQIVAAALDAMRRVYRSSDRAEQGEHLVVGDDYTAVVAAHLRSDDDEVLEAAIAAAGRLLREDHAADSEVTTILGELATSSRPEVAVEALAVLRSFGDWTENTELVTALQQALDHPEPQIVSQALNVMRRGSDIHELADELADDLLAATEHDNPGVRGRAIEVSARLPGFGLDTDEQLEQQVGQRAAELLEDDHPFVRSRAAIAIGSVDYAEAVPQLIEMVDDHTENRYELDGWTELDGGEGRILHDGSAWSRVSDAAMTGLNRIRFDDRQLGFDYDSPGLDDDLEQHLAEQAVRARGWYDDNRDQLN